MTGLRPRAPAAPADGDDLLELLLACHGRIRHFLAVATRLGHDTAHPATEVAAACAATRRYFAEALPLHVADEEHSLAPRLRGWSPEVDRALAQMTAEHHAHQAGLRALDVALVARAEVATTAAGQRALATLLPALTGELEAHLRAEEEVVFPALRQVLSSDTRRQVVAELRARRQPPSP